MAFAVLSFEEGYFIELRSLCFYAHLLLVTEATMHFDSTTNSGEKGGV